MSADSCGPFDRELALYYDRMIRWEKRLAAERPLFESLWKRRSARRVLDAACGSGGHFEMFIGQGIELTASDASPGMLELARRRAESIEPGRRPTVIESNWGDLPARVPGEFDVVLCLGNSLPYVTSADALEASLAGLWSRVAPGGALVIQFKNFALLRKRGDRFLPLSSHRAPDGSEMIAIRQYDWLEDAVDFLAIILEREAPEAGWRQRHWTTRLATWSPQALTTTLAAMQATPTLCGSLALEPFDPDASEDLVIMAERGLAT